MGSHVIIKGAKTHNLKNISVEIPKEKLVIFTGVSGSGKSSLVFDTINAEAQRQLIETFSAFTRARMPKIGRPDVDEIQHITPSIVIDQKRLGTTLRSTVGTATELYTYLRLLFSRVGSPFIGFSNKFSFNNAEGMCPHCNGLGQEMVVDETKIYDENKSVEDGAIIHSSYKMGGWFWRQLMNSKLFPTNIPIKEFTEKQKHNLLYKEATSVKNSHQGVEYNSKYEGVIVKLKRLYMDKNDYPGAYINFYSYASCTQCHGTRINEEARNVQINGKCVGDLVFIELPELQTWLHTLHDQKAIPIVQKMDEILQHLINIGVGYLSLHRTVATLSGGESQRVKMARQLGCNLENMTYILDEPSIGLHQRDIAQLVTMLKQLRDTNNSVFVVEHDPAVIKEADYIVDIGPKAGSDGGEVMFAGTIDNFMQSDTLTRKLLTRKPLDMYMRKEPQGFLDIKNASLHNLKNISTRIPKSVFTCVTGVAGSGKSTLINDVFAHQHPEAIVINQSPVGRSNRSNPMTYLGVFTFIREEFARYTGLSASMFSFNSAGACPKCNGQGVLRVEMSFLDDVKMTCDECHGKRYTDFVLEHQYQGKNIHEVLQMTVKDAQKFFKNHDIKKRLDVMEDVGLGYLELGQPLSTLSGGEAQRLKLASELHKKGNIYIMDEPTTGMHMADIEKLMEIILKLVANDSTVIVIEHNMDVIRNADWIIDLGPEGGSKGGEILVQGTPEEIIACEQSYTGQFLKNVLQ